MHRKVVGLILAFLCWLPILPAQAPPDSLALAPPDGTALASLFAAQVDRRLLLPIDAQQRYAILLRDSLQSTLFATPATPPPAQYLLLVDRSPNVQAIILFWLAPDSTLSFIGASPVSTGKPGQFEHFLTPAGVFDHNVGNPDYRAEGTRNQYGICGYGRKGMRVYDFGWVNAPQGWGRGYPSVMRLQMHATDPDFLEPSLGVPRSKGCVRIPATLNTFLDTYGILDADYERAMAEGKRYFVLSEKRTPTPWPGRYMVVVDSGAAERPEWSPLPIKVPPKAPIKPPVKPPVKPSTPSPPFP